MIHFCSVLYSSARFYRALLMVHSGCALFKYCSLLFVQFTNLQLPYALPSLPRPTGRPPRTTQLRPRWRFSLPQSGSRCLQHSFKLGETRIGGHWGTLGTRRVHRSWLSYDLKVVGASTLRGRKLWLGYQWLQYKLDSDWAQ